MASIIIKKQGIPKRSSLKVIQSFQEKEELNINKKLVNQKYGSLQNTKK